MKLTKVLMCAAVAGAMSFAAGNASAFPLKLTAVSGTLTVTSNYNTLAENGAKFVTTSFNMKQIMTIITNQVRLSSGTNPPAGSYVVYDPYLNTTYLTNSSGFRYFLGGIVSFSVSDVATTYHGNNNGGSENDKCLLSLTIAGNGPDGFFYVAIINGQGTINASYNSNADKATVTVSGNGAGFGESKNSQSGVAKGSFTFKGTGSPEWGGPYSIYWWNVID